MSAGFPPFPGGGAPLGAPAGFAPQQPQAGFGASPYPQQSEAQFVLDIPADPNWQPIEGGDTLEKDGFYAAKITAEKVRTDDGKLQVIFTVDLLDDDVMGKKLSKFMPDPRQTVKETWFLWRGLIRSIYGTIQHAQQALRYTPGMFTGAIVYFKSEAYADNRGVMRTGIGTWSTRDEWEEARKTNRHRWPAKLSGAQNPGVGALPGGQAPGFGGGLPGSPGGGLPGAPSGGLPGAPNVPTGMPGVPMPGSAPMQGAPPPVAGGFAPPPAGGFGFAPPPPVAAVQPAAVGGGFPPPPAGVPQPSANGIAAGFPGAGQPPR